MSQSLQSFTLERCILNGRISSTSLNLVLAWAQRAVRMFLFSCRALNRRTRYQADFSVICRLDREPINATLESPNVLAHNKPLIDGSAIEDAALL